MSQNTDLKREIEDKLRESLQDVEKNWKTLFTDMSSKSTLGSTLSRCFRDVADDLIEKGVTKQNITQNSLNEYIRPKAENILRCFNYKGPEEIKVIILGEDPYPTRDMADGLSFSFTNFIKNSSLKNIFACLEKSGLIDNIPEYISGLGYYASQGILLLNKNLTRTPEIVRKNNTAYIANSGSGNRDNSHDFWETFTTKVITYLLDLHKERGLVVLALGNKHNKIIDLVKSYNLPEKLIALHWNHPSPASAINNTTDNPLHFIHCPHFVEINNFLADTDQELIDWNPNADYVAPRKTRYLAFASDGGCKNNETDPNKKIEIGASAAYFPPIIKREKNSHVGMFSTNIFAYKYIYDSNKKVINVDVSEQISVNNDRAEILAVCLGLLEIYKFISDKPAANNDLYIIYIIVDNMHVFNLINNFDKIDKLEKSTKTTNSEKSTDLELILYTLMSEISDILGDDIIEESRKQHIANANDLKYNLERIGITTIHQPSHGKPDDYKKFRRELFDLNHTVDAEVNKLMMEYCARN